ncbi:MAG: hypothetical protein GC152_12395 [Alphaproteobacteria bacterium]|nr:hypothetical protein [Alphaproteobacteria bacterium]
MSFSNGVKRSRAMVVAAGWLAGAWLVGHGAASAQTAVTTIGSTDARICYEEANSPYGSAVERCDIALSRDDLSRRDRRATLVNRGIIRNRIGQYELAIADFNEALDGADELGEALLNRGNSRYLQKAYADAIVDYRAALASDFGKPEVCWYNIGLAEKASGNVAAARTAFIQATAAAPNFQPAREQLADLNAAAAGVAGTGPVVEDGDAQ